jgi:M6 family metalloprotease-like protein
VNGHILGSSQWTDHGWSTSLTDPTLFDPVTGQSGLWRFQDITPDRDDSGNAIVWNDGNVTVPAHRSMRMLVLFVQFVDRLALVNAPPYNTMQGYLDFIAPAAQWFSTSSYGQFQVSFAAPQLSNGLDWVLMDKPASQYTWDAQTHNMFAYAREAFQHAYDNWGIKADDYDLVLIMPAKGTFGLANGPGNINRDPTDGAETNINQVAYYDQSGNPHYVSTFVTAGNDMFSWGYRWLCHESGHTIGLPDLYMYSPTTVRGTNVNLFFWVGGWDIMGNIAGHSNDYLGYQKWKLRWIRDDQVDVVSEPGTTTHSITPIETPGGSKIVVVRTGVSTAYVVELRTKLGTNALDNRGKYQGALLYRLDASKWEQRDVNYDVQVISKQYYNDPAVGGPENRTGLWRPINNSIAGLDTEGALWLPGDTFEDPATGVTIQIDGIAHYLASDPANSPYTAADVATVTVTKSEAAARNYPVVLSNPQLDGLTKLTFDTNVELQRRITDSNSINAGHYTYVREESRLTPGDVVITKANGSVIPPDKITGIVINPSSVEVDLADGAFADAADAAGFTVRTEAYYYFAASNVTGQPTAVGVSSFAATRTRAGAALRWQVRSGVGVLGFELRRSANGGPYRRFVSPSSIVGRFARSRSTLSANSSLSVRMTRRFAFVRAR